MTVTNRDTDKTAVVAAIKIVVRLRISPFEKWLLERKIHTTICVLIKFMQKMSTKEEPVKSVGIQQLTSLELENPIQKQTNKKLCVAR